jgi:hypothetical protein
MRASRRLLTFSLDPLVLTGFEGHGLGAVEGDVGLGYLDGAVTLADVVADEDEAPAREHG